MLTPLKDFSSWLPVSEVNGDILAVQKHFHHLVVALSSCYVEWCPPIIVAQRQVHARHLVSLESAKCPGFSGIHDRGDLLLSELPSPPSGVNPVALRHHAVKDVEVEGLHQSL